MHEESLFAKLNKGKRHFTTEFGESFDGELR
jgi:hypothetical protein